MVKKRAAVAVVVSLFLCLAVYLNWSYQKGLDGELPVLNGDSREMSKTLGEAKLVDNQNPDADGNLIDISSNDDFFYDALEILKIAAQSDNEASKTMANEKIAALAANAVAEVKIENLVKAKGFAECVAFISDEGVSVVVAPGDEGLDSTAVARIKDIVVSETSVTSDLIKVLEGN